MLSSCWVEHAHIFLALLFDQTTPLIATPPVAEPHGKGGSRMNPGAVRNLWAVWEGDLPRHLGHKLVGGGDQTRQLH